MLLLYASVLLVSVHTVHSSSCTAFSVSECTVSKCFYYIVCAKSLCFIFSTTLHFTNIMLKKNIKNKFQKELDQCELHVYFLLPHTVGVFSNVEWHVRFTTL